MRSPALRLAWNEAAPSVSTAITGTSFRPVALQPGDDAGQQAAAADAGDDAVEFGALGHNLVDQRAVTFPEQRVIEGMHVGGLALGELDAWVLASSKTDPWTRTVAPVASIDCRTSSDGGFRNDDGNGDTECAAGIGGGDAGIAAGGAEDFPGAVFHLVLAQSTDTAQLEAA
jgi:hypothetical protein